MTTISFLSSLSGSSVGESAKLAPTSFGAQASGITPFGENRTAIRTGGFVPAAAAAPRAMRGIIASSQGKATAAPTPRKNVRRSIRPLTLIPVSLAPSFQERIAMDDRVD